ncbi:Lon protease-like protein, mitochondrial, partial [Frankliniella fusca]
VLSLSLALFSSSFRKMMKLVVLAVCALAAAQGQDWTGNIPKPVVDCIQNPSGCPTSAGGQIPQFPGNGQIPQFPGSGQIPQFPGNGQIPQFPGSGQIPQFPIPGASGSGASSGSGSSSSSGSSSGSGSGIPSLPAGYPQIPSIPQIPGTNN